VQAILPNKDNTAIIANPITVRLLWALLLVGWSVPALAPELDVICRLLRGPQQALTSPTIHPANNSSYALKMSLAKSSQTLLYPMRRNTRSLQGREDST